MECPPRALGVQVLDAAQQLHEAGARVALVVAAAPQHRIQQLAARQQLRDQVHLIGRHPRAAASGRIPFNTTTLVHTIQQTANRGQYRTHAFYEHPLSALSP